MTKKPTEPIPEMPLTADEHLLASSFDNIPNLYDTYRHGYPQSLFDQIAKVTELNTASRILEIGCGTGQATLPLAEMGFEVVAVEPGQELAKFTAQKVVSYPNVTVINDSFEQSDFESENFDLVLAAMSLHWVDEKVRSQKPHQLLKKGGHLAILYNWPLAHESTTNFYNAVSDIAQQNGMREGAFQGIDPDQAGYLRQPIDESLFEPFQSYVANVIHIFKPGFVFAGFLATLSEVSVLQEEAKYNFLQAVADMIKTDFYDAIELPYASSLVILRKR